MNNDEICPECNGHGFVFYQVRADARAQRKCPGCDGSGTRAAMMARVLTGEFQTENANYQNLERYKFKAHPFGRG